MMHPTPHDVAHSYLRRTWMPLPVPYRSKNPSFRGWQHFAVTEPELPRHFNGQPQNVGVLLGEPSDGLVDVDLDCTAAIVLAPTFLPATGATFGRASKRRSHCLYYAKLATRKFRDPLLETRKGAAEQDKAMLLELRSTGAQTVFPGSTHESGEAITWDEEGEPARVKAQALERAAARLAAASLLARYWPGGSRNDAANALAGGLLRAGWAADEVEQFIEAVCRAAQDEETQARVRTVVDTAAKLRTGEQVTGWPTLAEIIDKRIVSRVCQWLEIKGAASQQGKAANGAGGAAQDDAPLRVVCMADVAPEQVSWLWHPYIARGKLTILEGDPGLGKSWLTCAIACAVTRGRGLPDVESFEPGNVLMLSAEDGLGDTLRPRLDTVGADVRRVFALNEPLTFDAAGLLRLEAAIIEHAPALVIIDPLFAYTGGKVDIHRANECRAVSAPLAAVAERRGCAIVAVRHLGKSRGGGHALNAGIGSIDFTAAARSVLLVGQDPDEPASRALVQIKNNLAPFGPALGYKLEDGRFWWTGESDLTAERMLAAAPGEDERGTIKEAMDFLRAALSDGARDSKALVAEAKQAGIREPTLRRAKDRLRVSARKVGMPGTHYQKWVWEMPAAEGDQRGGEGEQAGAGDHLRASGAAKGTCPQHLAEGDQAGGTDHLRAARATASEEDYLAPDEPIEEYERRYHERHAPENVPA